MAKTPKKTTPRTEDQITTAMLQILSEQHNGGATTEQLRLGLPDRVKTADANVIAGHLGNLRDGTALGVLSGWIERKSSDYFVITDKGRERLAKPADTV